MNFKLLFISLSLSLLLSGCKGYVWDSNPEQPTGCYKDSTGNDVCPGRN